MEQSRNEPFTAATAAQKSDAIRKCLVSGLFPNAAYLHMSGAYRTVRGDLPLAVHPTSGTFSCHHFFRITMYINIKLSDTSCDITEDFLACTDSACTSVPTYIV